MCPSGGCVSYRRAENKGNFFEIGASQKFLRQQVTRQQRRPASVLSRQLIELVSCVIEACFIKFFLFLQAVRQSAAAKPRSMA